MMLDVPCRGPLLIKTGNDVLHLQNNGNDNRDGYFLNIPPADPSPTQGRSQPQSEKDSMF